MSVLEFQDVAKVFPGPPPVTALKPCSFRIEQGDLVTIVGPSGSGKSTLLNLAGLLDRPTKGKVSVNGEDTSDLPEHRRTSLRGHTIGFVFQAFHLMARRSVLDNVSLAGLYRGQDRSVRTREAAAAVALVGLKHRETSPAGVLSGGEKQRVAIARAMASSPALLLCDEPTGNLDTANSDAIVELLVELNNTGTTIAIITHNPDVAEIGTVRFRLLDGTVERV